jgi:hypothetical protein
MEEEEKRAPSLSRRGFLTGTGIFVAGGIAGYGTSLALPSTPTVTEAPPLPWKWTRLDPLEAGRRAYRSYLEKKG